MCSSGRWSSRAQALPIHVIVGQQAFVLAGHERGRDHENRGGAIARDRNIPNDRDTKERLDIRVVRLRFQRVPEEDDEIEPAFRDARAELLVAAERTALELDDGRIDDLFQQCAGRAGGVQFVIC